MTTMRSVQFALLLALVALLCPVFVNWIEAQKTIAKSTNNYRQVLSGGQPGSVYGGYQASSSSSSSKRRQQTLVAPVSQQSRYESSQSSFSAQRPISQQQASSSSYNYEEQQQSAEADAEPASYGSVAGQPGQDFPAYTRVPKTSFTCDGLPYEYGMYADEETGCQAYHLCYNGRKDSFLCGVGTVFNQRILHCDYWYSVDCGKSSQYYSSNAYMGSSQPEPGPAQASGSQQVAVQQQQVNSYKRTESSSSAGSAPVYPRTPAGSSAVSSWSRNRQEQQQIQEDS